MKEEYSSASSPPPFVRGHLTGVSPLTFLVCSLHQNDWHSFICKYPKRQVRECPGQKARDTQCYFSSRDYTLFHELTYKASLTTAGYLSEGDSMGDWICIPSVLGVRQGHYLAPYCRMGARYEGRP